MSFAHVDGDALHFGWDRAAGFLKQYIAALDSSQ